MKLSRKDLDQASECVISPEQSDVLWRALEKRAADRPRLDLTHVGYYFGALSVISAMG